jgi:putative peptidoglycan lipid II flippase
MTSRRRAFAGAVALTLAGQGVAVLYEISLADRFGTGVDADALALTFTIVVAVANEIVTGVSMLFIPRFVEAAARQGEAAAAGVLRSGLVAVALTTGLLALLLVALAPPLVEALAGDPTVRARGVVLTRLFSPLLVLLPLSMLLASAQQARGHFAAAGLRQLCWYGVTLGALAVFGARVGASAVPLGMVAGLALYCAILAAGLREFLAGGAGEAPPLGRARAGEGLGAALPPLAAASAANYANVAVERGIAARLPEGSLAALTYAFRLLHFPVNLLLLNAASILFPRLADHAARQEGPEFAALLLRALRLTVIFTAPLAALCMVLAGPVVQLLLERGAFTPESTRLTATALLFYAPGVVGIAGTQVLARAYQALHEVRRLVAIGIAVIALNIGLMLGLTHALGFPGLPAAMSLSPTVLFLAMLRGLRGRVPALDGRGLARSAARAVLAALVAAAAAGGLAATAEAALTAVSLGAGAGIALYAVLLSALSREDARLALAFVSPRLERRVAGPS